MTAAGGVVRPARRPAGWRAPGPAPAAPDDPVCWPSAGEDLCALAGDWRILQLRRGHRWSLDDLATAWLAAEVATPRRHADLGCGIGTVLLLLAWRFPQAYGVGVEAQAVSVGLARRSIAWNGVADRCRVVGGDLRNPAVLAGAASFDLVTATPPYLPPGTAHESARPQWGPCHVEQRGGIEDYARAAAHLLAPDGWFVTCAGGTQDGRVDAAAHAAGLVVVCRRAVVPRAGKSPLLAVHALRRRAAADGPPAVEAPLVVRDHAGRWTDGYRAVRRAFGMPDRPPAG
ncbi:MAG: methyltransferase [bacterium]|nr:methyltransferase [bacterium]